MIDSRGSPGERFGLAHPLLRACLRYAVLNGALVTLAVCGTLLVGFLPLMWDLPLLAFVFTSVRSARTRFASAEATEWMIAGGHWKRSDLARWTVLDFWWRVVILYAAKPAILWLLEATGRWQFDRALETSPALTLLFLNLLVLFQLPGCTWLPRRISEVRVRLDRVDARKFGDVAILFAILVLLCSPFVLGERPWAVASSAAVSTVLVFALIAGQETVATNARFGTASHRSSLEPVRSRVNAQRTALLWSSFEPAAKLTLAFALLSTTAVSLWSKFGGRHVPYWLGLSASLAWVALLVMPSIGIFRWRSHGPSAEYLAALGVSPGRLRQYELLVAPLFAALAMAASIATLRDFRQCAIASVPAAIVVFLASNRRTIALPGRRMRLNQVAIPGTLFGLIVPTCVAGAAADGDAAESVAVVSACVLLAISVWRWMTSWVDATEDNALLEENRSDSLREEVAS